jgi:hypothetical protein
LDDQGDQLVNRRALLAGLPLWVGAAAAQPLTQGATVPPCADRMGCFDGRLSGGTPSLDLSFMGGPLDPRLVFTRASTATYFDATGTLQTAAANAPRFDCDPVTHALRGLLIEESKTNDWLQSGDASNAAWTPSFIGASTAPVVTGHQTTAPDGTNSGARVAYPAGTQGAGSSYFTQDYVLTANPYAFSVWLKGTVGGERIYLSATPDGVLYYRTAAILTTQWQRFVLATPTLTAALWYFTIGYDGRDAGQPSVPAQTVYVWGGQLELGAFATSYIPTLAAAVTRANDVCDIPVSAWFTPNAFSVQGEFFMAHPIAGTILGVSDNSFAENTWYFGDGSVNKIGTNAGTATAATTNTVGAVNKQCGTFSTAQIKASVNGGGVGVYTAALVAPAGAMRLSIGTDPWSLSGAFDCHMRRVRFWPRELTNSEMQGVTS